MQPTAQAVRPHFRHHYIGEVTHEALGAGKTENNRWVNFAGPHSLIGHFAEVVVTEARPHSLRGRLHTANDSLPDCARVAVGA